MMKADVKCICNNDHSRAATTRFRTDSLYGDTEGSACGPNNAPSFKPLFTIHQPTRPCAAAHVEVAAYVEVGG